MTSTIDVLGHEEWLQRLSQTDQKHYRVLRDSFALPRPIQSRSGSSKRRLIDCFEQIRNFVVQGNEDDQQRGFVCGYLQSGNVTAINCRRLMTLTHACKATVNRNLQLLGYEESGESKTTQNGKMAEMFSKIRPEEHDLKHWSLRISPQQHWTDSPDPWEPGESFWEGDA
jgi:hypothetical protein